MTTQELEELAGRKIATSVVFVLIGARLFHRDDERWHEYPPYPPYPMLSALVVLMVFFVAVFTVGLVIWRGGNSGS